MVILLSVTFSFCYEVSQKTKNVTESAKSQDFGLETFFVKENNMENIAD